jgi:DNA-binding MarR family transcriptional regulator
MKGGFFMSTSKVKDGSYIAIQSFMVKDLKLKGNELLVYGIIYGFSKDGKAFNGSLQYLADWCNSTRGTIVSALKSLVKKEYLIKNEIFKDGVKYCEYYCAKPKDTIEENTSSSMTMSNPFGDMSNPFGE